MIEQAAAVSASPVVRDAWARGDSIAVHGWIYSVANGLLRDLEVTAASNTEAELARSKAVERIFQTGAASEAR